MLAKTSEYWHCTRGAMSVWLVSLLFPRLSSCSVALYRRAMAYRVNLARHFIHLGRSPSPAGRNASTRGSWIIMLMSIVLLRSKRYELLLRVHCIAVVARH